MGGEKHFGEWRDSTIRRLRTNSSSNLRILPLSRLLSMPIAAHPLGVWNGEQGRHRVLQDGGSEPIWVGFRESSRKCANREYLRISVMRHDL
jgi:hypothetical protein